MCLGGRPRPDRGHQPTRPRPLVPRLGQSFADWLPLFDGSPSDEYHQHFAGVGPQYVRSWIDDRPFCGVDVLEVRVTRRSYDLKSDVLGVYVTFAGANRLKNRQDFMALARQLFDMAEPTRTRSASDDPPRHCFLQFGKKGEASFHDN